MERDLYQRLRELYHELGDLDPAERAQRLATLQLDAEVERELLLLFDEGELAAQLDDSADGGFARYLLEASAEQGEDIPASIGPYRVERVLGRGGMGVVYLASQESPRRKVAVKVLRDLWGNDRERQRFLREAEYLGRLQHPGIAQVIEAGAAGQGARLDYIALEYVEGTRITEDARRRGLGRDDRARLLIDLCKAVHHAHSNGVIHRDLKPGNVLVTGDGQLKVIDFGVARAVGGDAPETMLTEVGHVVGTLSYMSPEQIQGNPGAADARSDVYAIGVLAFELFSGGLPRDLESSSLGEAVRLLTEVDAPPLGKVAPDCRGDLELIVSKALERETERRYQSVAELEADLVRFLASEPIHARAPSALYQLRRFARRNKALVAGSAATLAAIILGSAVAVHYAIKNHRLAELEHDARELAEDRLVELNERALELERLGQREREARELAEGRLVDLNERTEELVRMTDLQETVLHEVDAAAVGEALRNDLLTEARGMPGVGVDEFLERLDTTRLSAQMLDHAILAPSVERIDVELAALPRARVRMMSAVAENRWNLGLGAALDAFERALELSIEAYGPDAVQTHELEIQVGAALMRHAVGHLRPGENPADFLRRGRELTERGAAGLANFDAHPQMRAAARLTLSQMYAVEGQSQKAFETLELWYEELGDREPHTQDLVAMRRLAKFYGARGQTEKAIDLLRTAVQGFEADGNETHTAFGQALTDLGNMLGVLEEYEEAEAVLRYAVEVNRRERGDLYRITVQALDQLGIMVVNQGRPEEALDVFQEAAASLRRMDSPAQSAELLLHLALTQNALEQHREALETAEEGVAVVERAFRGQHRFLAPLLTCGQEAAEGLAEANVEGAPADGWQGVADGFRRRLEALHQ